MLVVVAVRVQFAVEHHRDVLSNKQLPKFPKIFFFFKTKPGTIKIG